MEAADQLEASQQSLISAVDNAANQRSLNHQKNLVFELDGEKYGIPLSAVKEVIGITQITPVPHVPDFFKGLINLRGKIISVIDLRLKLNLTETPYESKKTSIIITDVNDISVGAIVDDVVEVIGLSPEHIDDQLDLSTNSERQYLAGVAKHPNDSLMLLLDLKKVLDDQEWHAISESLVKTQSSVTGKLTTSNNVEA